MKKILSTLSAAAMLVAAVALVGCSGAVQANATDILEEIEAPSVTVKAYPGFIRLTWNKVNGASSYKIYRDGKEVKTVNNGAKTEWNDVADKNSNLINGKTYTYDVVAFAGDDYAYNQDASSTASARAVYVKQAMTTVTETANVPSVADFTEYYKDYFEKFTAEDTALKTELVTVDGINYIKVTAPTLPEFNYKVTTFVENTPDPFKDTRTVVSFTIDSEDKTEFFRPVTSSGTYNVVVKVDPESELYAAKEFNGSKAEVKALDTSSVASNATAKYTTTKTVRIAWNPVSASNVDYATADYSVFRVYANTYTKVAGDVAVLNPGDINGTQIVSSKTYYIDDTIEEGTVPSYALVLSKNGAANGYTFDISNSLSNLNYSANLSGVNASYIDEGKTVRVKFYSSVATDKPEMYTVYRQITGNNIANLEKLGTLKSTTYATVNASATTNSSITYKTYFYVDDTIKDNTVGYTYKIYRTENTVPSNLASTTVVAYDGLPNAGTPSVLTAQATCNDKDLFNNDVWVTFRLGDNTDSFKLYRANITNNNNPLDSDFVAVNATAYASATANYATLEYVLFDGNLAKGTYRYKLVESAAGKKDAAKTVDVPVYATTGVSGFSVSWDSTNHKIIFSDSYDTKKETPNNYTYAYQIVKKTTNDLNSYYVVADEALTAISLPDYGAAVGGYQAKRAEVIKSITANATDSYQVIAVKTDSVSGKKFYAVTSPVWVTSN